MSALLGYAVALTRPEDRAAAAAALGRALGGSGLIVFVRDEAVGALLPAPGFAQSLPNARAWRDFLEACATGGEARAGALAPAVGHDAVPVYGVGYGCDAVAAVLGATERPADVAALRDLLPLLAATFRGERAAANAETQARLAEQAARHAEALAAALDAARAQAQRALAEAGHARAELERANRTLQDQAAELEMQTEALQRTNAELDAAREGAERASRAKSDFLATMSHELRTPLNAIGGHVQLIQMGIHGAVTDAQREALRRVDRGQRHLLGLINDILNLARIESGRLEYRLRDVRLADTLADLAPMIEPQLAAKRLRFAVHVDDSSVVVRADAEKLEQILLNLLSNAVKFTGAGGAITVRVTYAEASPDTALVHVIDTGIGIPADRIGDIFEPFVQIDARHIREGEGTGLGLAISRDLARGMGGELTAASTLGVGSTFTLALPRA